MSTVPLCIYHSQCDDGFGAAWAVRQALGTHVEFHPGVYQQEPPDVTGRDVIMVDFSYKRPVLERMAKVARSILILDHHHTAQEDLHGFERPAAGWDAHMTVVAYRTQRIDDTKQPALVFAEFDMTRSGAGMTWDWFRNTPRPALIDYIEDRDLWRKALPDGDLFTLALRSYPQQFPVWDTLAGRVPALIEEGRAIHRYYRLRVEDLKRSAYETILDGHPIWIANAPYFAASEVAGELAQQDGAKFGACYFEVSAGRYQYSLRSRGDFDVSAVAKKFGGGGHKAAAGFTTPCTVHSGPVPAFLRKPAASPITF